MLRIKLSRSPISENPRNRATVEALGLRKLHQVVEREDSPSLRGMLRKVAYMLTIEDENGNSPIPDSRTFKRHVKRTDPLPGGHR